MDRPIKFGSVCSGIEAASVAWMPLGWRAAWLSEIEPFPCAVLAHHYPDVPNLGDMTALPERIAAGEVEAPDVFCGGTPCFTAGHMVLTSSGYRPIECLVPGDEVMTHNGRLRKILRVGSKVAPVGRLSAVGLPDGITCTEDHPFLSSCWRNQSTKRNNAYAKVETCSEPEWVAAKNLPGRQWCALSKVEPTACKPDSRLFDERTAMYVAGMYLGDGWIRGWGEKRKKTVLLGINEAKYQKLLAVIGQTAHSISHERTVIKVSFGDTAFAHWLDANFGCLSHRKTIPAWVMGHPHSDALLQGYMDTDGCVEKGKVTINSTSKSLAHGVCDLLTVRGWSASVAKVETSATCVIEGRTVNQRDYFQVRANNMSISRKSRVRHGYLMRTVQTWESCGEEAVFNIEVEDDNSFILNGAVVHNCQAFSVAGLRKSLDDARGNLSLTFCEIANAIDSVRSVCGQPPAIIFWENVFGVLSTKDNAFGCFLAGLAGEDDPLVAPGGKWTNAGCVFGPQRAVAWRVLDAQYFGVAQRRRRVFVVASARKGFDPAAVLFESEGVRRDIAPRREAGEVAPTIPARSTAGGGLGTDFDLDGGLIRAKQWPADVASTLDTTFGTKQGLEDQHVNAGCPVYGIPGNWIGRRPENGGNATAPMLDISPCLTSTDRHGVAAPALVQQPIITMAHGQGGAEIGFDCGPTLTCNHEAPIAAIPTTTHTLRGEGFDASEDGTGRGTPIVPAAYATKLHNTASNGAGKFYENYTASLDASSPPPAIVFDASINACSLTYSWENKGINILESTHASPQETDAIALLRRVRKAIGAKAFAQWGLGILDSLQQAEILRSALHGSELRPAAFSRRWVVCCALGSPFSRSAGAMHSMREAAGEGCSSQGWGFSEQHFDELGAYLSELPQPGAQAERLMRHLWQASEGVGVLRDALSAVQEARRPAGHQGQPVRASSTGGSAASAEDLQGAGLHGQVPREGVLQQACPASSQRDAGTTTTDQERSGFGAMAARRLIVEECEFLQGFARGYTMIPWRKKSADQCPDGPRYRALGNSWAIPCVYWIGRRIQHEIAT